MKLAQKIKNRLFWFTEDIKFFFLLNIKSQPRQTELNKDYSIGVTTFLDRYNIFFKQLIKKLAYLFPDKEIIVAVNGHVKKNTQKKYLENIEDFVSQFSNVFLITYKEPQGLSKLWNEIIKKAGSSKILLLNDDLKVAPDFRVELEDTGMLHERIAVINKSWAHFLISKNIIDEVGWFDENLLEIGGEDDDYSARLAIENIPIKHLQVKSIANFSKPLKSNSFGKDMTGEHRYSEYNSNYLLNEKWIVNDEPFEGAVYVPDRKIEYWRLRNSGKCKV